MSAHGAKIALMVSDVYIDSNIFIYAIDGSGELKTKAKARLEQLVAEGFHLHSSEIAIGARLPMPKTLSFSLRRVSPDVRALPRRWNT